MIEMYSALQLTAALACGLMIGIERGWRLRENSPGSRVAGVRTFTLLGAVGGVAALLAELLSPAVAVVVTFALAAGILIGFLRDDGRRDATSFVAAILVIGLGLLAGAGEPALAVSLAAIVTFVLAARTRIHGLIERLNSNDVQAFARYAVIAGAVLPFLPNRQMGPFNAWNPFQLWLVVVLVTGFSFAGYIATRVVGARKGILATAIIGGAYSSTAVTASLSQRLGKGEQGPFSAGIALASAVMYLRVFLLVAVLTPSTFSALLTMVGPAMIIATGLALLVWIGSGRSSEGEARAPGNPIELLPALSFVAIVAVAAIATRWAQLRFGQSGIATSLFLVGSFDVDAAIITLSAIPPETIDRELAALALGSTIVANMLLKIMIVVLYGRKRGVLALFTLTTSATVLFMTLLWRGHVLGYI